MVLYSDSVSIAATTAGVAGTVNVPTGAKLIGMNLAYFSATAAVPTKVSIAWQGCPRNLDFVPNVMSMLGTSGGAMSMGATPTIPLNIVLTGANTVTVTITSSGNLTVQVSLMWEAA
jgi:hypothetical protein